MLIEQPLRFSRNLRTFRMYPRLDIFNQWLHAAIRLFSTVISNRPQMTSICGKDKKVADEPQVSAVSLIFILHFFIRFKKWRERERERAYLTPLFNCCWISLGIFQVINTTFRLCLSFSSLSYLWAVFSQDISGPSSKKNELPKKFLKQRFSPSDDIRSWQPLWKFISSSSGIRDDDDFVDDDRTQIQCSAQARTAKLRRLISVVDNDKQSRIASSCNHKLWQVQIHCF